MLTTVVPTGLQTLPPELVCMMANRLPDADFKRFRATSRTVQAKTFGAFKDRFFKHRNYDLDTTRPEEISSMLDNQELGRTVRSLTVMLPNCHSSLATDRQDLFLHCLLKIPRLHTIDINGSSDNTVHGLLHALRVSGCKITTFTIRRCNIDFTQFREFLSTHKSSLRAIRIFDVVCNRNITTWADVLEFMRDNLKLDDLCLRDIRLSKRSTRSRDPVHWDFSLPSHQRLVDSFFNPGTERLDYYLIYNRQALVTGKKAIRPGIEALLGITSE